MYSNSISKNGCLVSPFLLLWSSVMVAMLVFVTESHASCPITTQAATGPEQSAIVKFIDCSQSGPSDPPSCGAVQKQVTLIKDVTTNVGLVTRSDISLYKNRRVVQHNTTVVVETRDSIRVQVIQF